MRKDAINVYKKIQKTAERAIKTIDTLSDKVYDEGLSTEISKQVVEYAEIHNRALKELVDAKADVERSSTVDDFMLKAGIHYSTLLNTSTGHVAELIIKKCSEGMLEMEKVLRHNEEAEHSAVALARELLSAEERNMGALKSYL